VNSKKLTYEQKNDLIAQHIMGWHKSPNGDRWHKGIRTYVAHVLGHGACEDCGEENWSWSPTQDLEDCYTAEMELEKYNLTTNKYLYELGTILGHSGYEKIEGRILFNLITATSEQRTDAMVKVIGLYLM